MTLKTILRNALFVVAAVGLSACGGSGNGNTTNVSIGGINIAPVASALTVEAREDGSIEAKLPASDEDGDALTFVIVTQPENGSVVIDGDTATYTPAANFSGTDSFSFKVNDGTSDSDVATVTLNVEAVADAPVANAVTASTNEDTAVDVTLSATDADGDALTYVIVTQPNSGTLSAFTGNKVTYTPATNFNGSDSFTYKANDGTSDSEIVTVALNVTALNDAPVASPASANTTEDTPVEIMLSASDADGDTLTYVIVTQPSSGTLSAVTGNKVTYTPLASYNGSDSFTYKANDGTSDSATATVTLNIAAVNDAPVATAVTATTNEDSAVVVTLSATDADGDTLTYVIVTQPSSGTLSAVTGNKVTYTPAADYNGSNGFTYKANDGTSDSAAATVTLNIAAVNDAPVATAVTATTNEDSAVEVTLSATDADGDALTYGIVTQPSSGTLSAVTGNKVTYTPAADYNGSDGFTYKANDGTGDSETVTVALNVEVVNDAPVTSPASTNTNEDTDLEVVLGATDKENDALTYLIVEQPKYGELGSVTDNRVIYTPNTGYVGSDSFVFKANDGSADSNRSVITLSIEPLNIGQLIDSPVSGLHYSTRDYEGVTDSEGMFRYSKEGDTIDFKLGNQLVLGSALSTEKIHIYDFKETETEALLGKNKRLAQVLQSLDADKNSANGIQLPDDMDIKITDSTELNFLVDQASFDKALQSHLTQWEIDNFVSYDEAKSEADKFALELLEECPIPLPSLSDIQVSMSLSCVDRARVNYFQTRVSPYLRQSLIAAYDQSVLVEEEFTEESLSEIIELNPVLSALQIFDAGLDIVEAENSTPYDELGVYEGLIKLFATSVQTLSKSVYVYSAAVDESVDSDVTKAKMLEMNRYIEIGTQLMKGVLHTPSCITLVKKGGDSSDDEVASCTKAIISLIHFSKELEYFELLDEKAVEAVVDAFVASLQVVVAVNDLTKVGQDGGERIRAAWGLAEALVGVARQGIEISLINGEEVGPGLNVNYLTTTTIDALVLPALAVAKECASELSGVQLSRCLSTGIQESSKAMLRASFAIVGGALSLNYVKTMNNSLVAEKVLQEFLAVGSANHKEVYDKFGITYGGDLFSSIRLEGLIGKIGEHYGYTPINVIDPFFVEWKKASIDGDNPFSVVDTKALVSLYFSRIINETPIDFYSLNAEISAEINSDKRGYATINLVADLPVTNFNAGCYSDDDSSYSLGFSDSLSEIWSSDMTSLIPATFEINYSLSGTKGVFCNFYRKSDHSYIGSQVLALIIDGYDNDADGMLDEWELGFPKDFDNPNQPFLDINRDDSSLDADHDGLSNLEEFKSGTNPVLEDSDGDGMPDGWEVTNRLNPLENDALLDSDGDQVSNIKEWLDNTSADNAEDFLGPEATGSIRLIGKSTNPASVQLAWDAVDLAESYVVFYSTESLGCIAQEALEYCSNYQSAELVQNILGEAVTVTEGLTAGETYYFVVAGVLSGKIGSVSEQLEVVLDSDSAIDLSVGLVAHYAFEGNGNDSSNNQFDATETNVSYIDGINGKAAHLPNGNGFLLASHDWPELQNFTISMHVKLDSYASDATAQSSGSNIFLSFDHFAQGYGLENALQLALESEYSNELDDRYLGAHITNERELYSQKTSDGFLKQWTSLVYVREGDQFKVYVNGQLFHRYDAPSTVAFTPESLTVGKHYLLLDQGLSLFGAMDELRIYDRAVSPLEIEELSKKIVISSGSSSVLKTGQVTSYINYDDGWYQAGVEADYQRDPITNTVYDRITGITWEDSINDTAQMDWYSATSYCESLTLAGFDDWSLPTMHELLTVASSREMFISEKSRQGSWSKEDYLSSYNAYLLRPVSQSLGSTVWLASGTGKSALHSAQCVRSSSVPEKLIERVNDVVLDHSTGLSWQDDSIVSTTAYTFEEAILNCESMELDGYSDWRLPNINELYSITDYARTPAILNAFQYVAPSYNEDCGYSACGYSGYSGYYGDHSRADKYVSSTTYSIDESRIYSLDINFGVLNISRKSTAYFALRCVRD